MRSLAKAGIGAVALNYRKSSEAARELAAELERGGVQALAVQADVQSDPQVRGMIDQIRGKFGRLDILVNNAGVTHWVKLADLEGVTDQIWDEILDVNVKGAFRCARAAAVSWPGESEAVRNQPLWNPTASVPPPRTSNVSRPEMITTDRLAGSGITNLLVLKHRGESDGPTLWLP